MLDYPALEITTNIGCPLACEYCPQRVISAAYARRSSVFVMTFDCFRECLEKVPLDVAIDFSGMSEPWQNPECTRMVLHAVGRGYMTRIHTTLHGMTLQDVRELAPLPLDAFRVHLPSRERLENMTVNAAYLNLLDVVAERITMARFICFGERANPEVERVLRNHPCTRIRFASPSNRAEIRCADGKPLLSLERGRIRCSNHARYNVLLPNGDVTLCCMDYGLKHLLGNLRELSYYELFRNHEFERVCAGFDDPLLDTICRHCPVFARHATILDDLRYHIPHWIACMRGMESGRQRFRAMIRNVRRYGSYFRKS